MKKKLILISILASAQMFGASIDHIMNYTPEYDGNPALQGAISEQSSANYNPSSLTELDNGLYVNGGIQTAIGKQSMEYNGKEYAANHISPIPNLSVVSKNDKRAFFWTIGGVAGGAKLDYENGIAAYGILGNTFPYNNIGKATDTSNAEGESTYIQTTIGTAFKLNDKLSLSLAGRAVYGIRDFKGSLEIKTGSGLGSGQTATIDAERRATGFGGQLGLNYKATEKLNIGLRYDSKVKLEFETKSTEQKITGLPAGFGYTFGFSNLYPEYTNGAKGYRDLPAILALGAQYEANKKWKLYLGGNYYFNKEADLDEAFVANDKKYTRQYSNGWELAAGTEYWLKEKLALLAGVNYAITGASADNFRDSEYAIDSTMIGTGIKYKYSDKLELTGTVAHYLYTSEEGKTLQSTVEYKKNITTIGLGFSKKI